MKALPIAACLCLLAACSGEQTNDNFTANVADVEEVPADESDSNDTPATMPEANGTAADAGATTALAATDTTRDVTGRWIGVEGMVLNVARGDAPGRYTLEMQYDLDHRQKVEGRVDGDGIVFVRDGKTMRLRPTDGDATGLKWLAGKRDCLTVARGEGYCRA